MLSLFEMLSHPPVEAMTRKPSDERYQRNAHKPCSQCGKKPRHMNQDGVCIATVCGKCYRTKNKIYNGKKRNVHP